MAKDDLLQCALIIVMKQAWIESSVFLLLVDHDEGAVFMLSVLFYVTFTTYEIIYPFPFTFIVYFKEDQIRLLRMVLVFSEPIVGPTCHTDTNGGRNGLLIGSNRYINMLRYVVVWQTVVMLYWSPLNLKSR
ncbi:hypothetical protein L6164_003862 [Bauhinia variegata]|uniref:Uncharacterized protein n=1 Tax=Bauhinia variegata TaxID=167791 RepID=A0ACB9Q2N5_BAUVA|nr:hypothetical protein L6164_003862 [Bauhinia variegata]